MQVLIAGAGYVGLELARQLAEAGHRVWAARRRETPLPPGVEPWRCDLLDPGLVVPEGVTHLAYTAAPDHGDAASYERIYVEGLRSVLAAFERAGRPLERVVFTSSTAVYGGGGDVDESSPTTAEGNARHLLAAEALALAHAGGSVVRLAGIYGPGRSRLVRMVREGTARCARSRPIGNRIHRDDCAGRVKPVPQPPSPARILGCVPHAPAAPGRGSRGQPPQLGLPAPPETDELDARGGSRKRCSNARLVASGYRFRHATYREGYAELLAEDGKQTPP